MPRREPDHRPTVAGRRGIALFLATAVLVAVVAGCSDDNDEPAATTRPGGSTGRVIGSGSQYEATIRRGTAGVPHVTGKTITDAAFGQGFASGEDHTCHLADQIVKIKGERSRWNGAGEEDANLKSDLAWRAIGIYERAVADWEEVAPENQAMFEAFAAGWNLQLETVGADDVPGWCHGQPWLAAVEPVDVYAYARSVVLLASSGRLTDYIATAEPPASALPPTTTTAATTTTAEVPGDTSVQPPDLRSETSGVPAGVDLGRLASSIELAAPGDIGSNGWAIGAERSESGGGMLLANPHFPWEGELRFWEVHLTVPGEVDIYGAHLTGLPGIGIGFTDQFAWTHTVSAGTRFTAYQLDLKPGSPTTYRYGDEWRDMTPTTHNISVMARDGSVDEQRHTTWATHYGPVINFPGFGWTEAATITYRDANIDNDEFVDQYFGMLNADDFDQFVDSQSTVNGIPLFNTVATSADGRAWYADTSATPNLSAEALAAYETARETDPITKIAADSGAVLLDGSDPMFEWVEEDGARDPGLVPPSRQPSVERDDYVFNANDSFWMPHATALLTGDYSVLHGRQGTVRSTRTRENATVLDDTTATGPSGEDGKFSLDELADAALANRGYTTRTLLEPVVERCQAVSGPVSVPPMEGTETAPGLPAGSIDIGPACEVLAAWDGVYDLDRAGPPLWREFLTKYPSTDLFDRGTGTLWAEPFDPAHPLTTPSGLAPAPAGAIDPVAVNLARAVQALEVAGFEPGDTLGTVQFVVRDGARIPIHGGTGVDGTTNVVGPAGLPPTVLDPALVNRKQERLVAGSALYRMDGQTGTPIIFGTSFLMALEYTKDGPRARAFLTYGNSEDPAAATSTESAESFSAKKWRDIEFTESAVAKSTKSTITIRG